MAAVWLILSGVSGRSWKAVACMASPTQEQAPPAGHVSSYAYQKGRRRRCSSDPCYSSSTGMPGAYFDVRIVSDVLTLETLRELVNRAVRNFCNICRPWLMTLRKKRSSESRGGIE